MGMVQSFGRRIEETDEALCLTGITIDVKYKYDEVKDVVKNPPREVAGLRLSHKVPFGLGARKVKVSMAFFKDTEMPLIQVAGKNLVLGRPAVYPEIQGFVQAVRSKETDAFVHYLWTEAKRIGILRPNDPISIGRFTLPAINTVVHPGGASTRSLCPHIIFDRQEIFTALPVCNARTKVGNRLILYVKDA